MIINTNINALNSHRNVKRTAAKQDKASAKLSSGLKINSAADDAAGLAISEKMRAQIRGLERANKNVGEAINLTRTAEGGLSQIQDMLHRSRELIIQALNDTNSDEDRDKIQAEIDQIKAEINSIADRTEYNKIPLLKGNAAAIGSIGTGSSGLTSPYEIVFATPPYCDSPHPGSYDFAILTPPELGSYHSPIMVDSGLTSGPFGAYGPTLDVTINGVTKQFPAYMGGFFSPESNWVQTSTNTWEIQYSAFDTDVGASIISITNRVSIVDNPDNIGGKSFHIEFELENLNPTEDMEIEFMFKVTPILSYATGVLHDSDDNVITSPVSYSGASIPDIIEYKDIDFNNYDDHPYQTFGIIRNGLGLTVINEPDKVEVPDEYSYHLTWSGKQLAPGESITLDTYYGARCMLDTTNNGSGGSQDENHQGIYIQTGANANQGMYINLCDARTVALGVNNVVTRPKDAAIASLGKLDVANGKVSDYRSRFGIYENRLSHIEASNSISSINLIESESRIRDADMAKEYISLVKANVLNQAGMSMLAQANQSPEMVLNLLK